MKIIISRKLVFVCLVGMIMLYSNVLRANQDVRKSIEELRVEIQNLQGALITARNTKGNDTKSFDNTTKQIRIKLEQLDATIKKLNENDLPDKNRISQELIHATALLQSLEKAKAQSQWLTVETELQQLDKSVREVHSVVVNKPRELTGPVSQPPPPTAALPNSPPKTLASPQRPTTIPSTVVKTPSDSMPSVMKIPAKKHKITRQQEALSDLYVSEFSISPSLPQKDDVVEIRIGVYNQGGTDAEAFTVEWWPGENYQAPGCTWRVESLVPRGGRILKCSGYVYPSSYSRITTVVKIDPSAEIDEQDEDNNVRIEEIEVLK